MAKPDPNRVLRLPIVVGGLAGILLLINRLLTPQLTNSQARADARDFKCNVDFDGFVMATSTAAIT